MPQPLPISSGLRTLRRLLGERGGDPPLSVADAWAAFRDFVEIPFDTASDGTLFESGRYAFEGREAFHLDFVRQFEVRCEDGAHDHYEQVRCVFEFPVTDRALSFSRFRLWWFREEAEGSWAAFVSAVEACPEFQAFRYERPARVRVEQDVV